MGIFGLANSYDAHNAQKNLTNHSIYGTLFLTNEPRGTKNRQKERNNMKIPTTLDRKTNKLRLFTFALYKNDDLERILGNVFV